MSRTKKWRYIRNVLVAVDQLANSLIGGDPDETISSRLGKCQRGDYGRTIQNITILPRVVVNFIFFLFDGPNHCKQSLEEDEGSQDLLKEK